MNYLVSENKGADQMRSAVTTQLIYVTLRKSQDFIMTRLNYMDMSHN